MLQELSIRDFALIEQMNVDFQDEMTVLTGETGAGKSIIIDALGLLAGGRGSSDFIRKGENKAVIQGLFLIPDKAKTLAILEEVGIENQDDGLILQRDLYRSGRNVCRINGNLVNLATLRRVGETLIDIHGQNEHQELMRPENHINLLDSYANDLQPLLQEYQVAYDDYQKLATALAKREENEKLWAQRMDMLEFQAQEIKEANLRVDEEVELKEEKDRLDNYQAINKALRQSYEFLSGDTHDALGNVGVALESMQKISDLSPKFGEIAQSLADAYYTLQDASRDVYDQLDEMEWDENRLNQIEQRLELIYQLKRKYGDSVAEILRYYQKIVAELNEMQEGNGDSAAQKQAVELAKQKALKLAQELSQKRQEIAQDLQRAVHKQLAALYMEKAIFEVKFKKGSTLNSHGLDKVEFYLQANPGESMGPLAKIASGGELSRIMLALKTIFSQQQGVTSIIFDEVDTGVSGRVAEGIAEKISQVARNSQVLCITHLPQVAAIAQHQYFIAKHVHDGRTETSLEILADEARVKEIARMLAGSEITDLALQHAKELLKLSAKIRQQIK
ncbi:DNA repair protein RecN [Ligilactobacillus equi]|uniref:DNA repair protein RecN n=1 Tax=Ligilactobacillus equi DSM 15833 = JCM 10991 TaxID=1423740 RepID=A0A0R1U1V4_9LACO|nr:DNA repair protein RecN [Ligilactobacillus equi]KRL85192.1 DNA repair protein [Ligilactobacillus equi DSM 15833 = JCM 10991]